MPRSAEPSFQLNPNVDRRAFMRLSAVAAGSVGLSSLLAACGAGGASQSGGKLTLTMPFLEDMQVPDPDIMYEGEGVQVMHAAYEGLCQYKPGTSEVIPLLAESWTLSSDNLTYTFKLKPNVKFHDGTLADAQSWIDSFDRRAKVNQGPAYMVQGIAKSEAPDPTTLVVTLKAPNQAFLHYLACPWHPLVTSPTAVKKYAKGDDLAQGWLKTHDAGTGPFVISEFVPGSHYTLTKFKDYWGGDVGFDTIRIAITPDVSTQKLQLDSGAFDIVTKGFPVESVKSYQKNGKFTVPLAFGGGGNAIWLNFNRPLFSDKALRQALVKAIDRKPIVETGFGGLTQPQKGYWPDLLFDASLVPLSDSVDTADCKALVAKLSDKTVDVAWGASGGEPNHQMANQLQIQLAALGFDATVRQLPTSQEFDLANQPQSKRPDILVDFMGGDALHLDTVLRILLRTDAKPLNFFGYSNPQLDKLMDDAVVQPTVEKMNAIYVQATKLLEDDAIYIMLCNTPYPIIAQKDITGIVLDSDYPEIFDSSKIRRSA
ncbi:ABC transporter substrate-binding protein [Nocardioides sp. AN3]